VSTVCAPRCSRPALSWCGGSPGSGDDLLPASYLPLTCGSPAGDRHGSGSPGRAGLAAAARGGRAGHHRRGFLGMPSWPGHPRGGRGESSPRYRHRARGAPVIAKYTGVLAAADIEVFTATTTFQIMQSLRSTAGPADRSTPDRNAAGPGQRRSWCGPGDLRAGLDPGRAHCGDQAPSRSSPLSKAGSPRTTRLGTAAAGRRPDALARAVTGSR
jgi:hypothetical protein